MGVRYMGETLDTSLLQLYSDIHSSIIEHLDTLNRQNAELLKKIYAEETARVPREKTYWVRELNGETTQAFEFPIALLRVVNGGSNSIKISSNGQNPYTIPAGQERLIRFTERQVIISGTSYPIIITGYNMAASQIETSESPISSAISTEIGTYNVSVGTTPTALPNQTMVEAVIKSSSANTVSILIGSSASQDFSLEVGETVTLPIDQLSSIYAVATTTSELEILWRR